jgi:DNA-binding Lrp family transcriptional regulator
MDALDRRIINELQGDFPVCAPHPYREVADRLGSTESELITRIGCMLDDGLLTRFGPMFHAEHMGGALSLCAMRVPPDRFDAVADSVNALPEVAHNYQRDHEMNMWFVLATETPEALQATVEAIESPALRGLSDERHQPGIAWRITAGP